LETGWEAAAPLSVAAGPLPSGVLSEVDIGCRRTAEAGREVYTPGTLGRVYCREPALTGWGSALGRDPWKPP
jgi:hypothetical protein